MRFPRYAFWRYDQFPYCLGGKIVRESDDGTGYMLDPKKWGRFHLGKSQILKIMTVKEGRATQYLLDRLRDTCDQLLATVMNVCEQDLKKILPEALVQGCNKQMTGRCAVSCKAKKKGKQ